MLVSSMFLQSSRESLKGTAQVSLNKSNIGALLNTSHGRKFDRKIFELIEFVLNNAMGRTPKPNSQNFRHIGGNQHTLTTWATQKGIYEESPIQTKKFLIWNFFRSLKFMTYGLFQDLQNGVSKGRFYLCSLHIYCNQISTRQLLHRWNTSLMMKNTITGQIRACKGHSHPCKHTQIDKFLVFSFFFF